MFLECPQCGYKMGVQPTKPPFIWGCADCGAQWTEQYLNGYWSGFRAGRHLSEPSTRPDEPWRCQKCGEIIFELPCSNCGNAEASGG